MGNADHFLGMVFGITQSPLSLFLRFGRRILYNILKNDPYSVVRLPTADEVHQYQESIGRKYHLLRDVWAVMDGCKLNIEASGNGKQQRKFYNGWTHGHYISNLFAFAPDGTIVACVSNCPGSVHDSLVGDYSMDRNERDIYDRLEIVCNTTNGKVVVDSAFCKKRFPFLIKSSQTDPTNRRDFERNNQATSVRQAAEWGNRGLQGAFPRLKGKIRWEEMGERKYILDTMFFLYNFRTRRVGLNQILAVFMPHQSIKTEQYFRANY